MLENLLATGWSNVSDPLEDQIGLKRLVIEEHVDSVARDWLACEACNNNGDATVAERLHHWDNSWGAATHTVKED